jgi:hypothetical protein
MERFEWMKLEKKQLMNEMIIQKMVGGIKLAFYVLL